MNDGRRLVQFYAGGRTRKKAKPETEDQSAGAVFKKGGKVKVKAKVVVKKAKGGMPGAVAGAKHRANMAMADPMAGRLTTGVVAPPKRKAMPAIGGALGALGGLGPIR